MESIKNIITFSLLSTPHLCSAGSARCSLAEGSWKTWPGVPAAPHGWCSWSSSYTRWPGVPGRPCGSWPRRLSRRGTAAQRGGGKGDGAAVGGWGVRAAERGRQVCNGAEREGQGQTRGKAPTERRGQMAEQPVRGRSFSVPCRCTNTGTHTRQEKVILTVTLSTSGRLERRKVVGHWAR